MSKLYIDEDRYGDPPASVLVEAVHNAVKDLVRRRLDDSGGNWSDFVFGASDKLITTADIAAIEQDLEPG